MTLSWEKLRAWYYVEAGLFVIASYMSLFVCQSLVYIFVCLSEPRICLCLFVIASCMSLFVCQSLVYVFVCLSEPRICLCLFVRAISSNHWSTDQKKISSIENINAQVVSYVHCQLVVNWTNVSHFQIEHKSYYCRCTSFITDISIPVVFKLVIERTP